MVIHVSLSTNYQSSNSSFVFEVIFSKMDLFSEKAHEVYAAIRQSKWHNTWQRQKSARPPALSYTHTQINHASFLALSAAFAEAMPKLTPTQAQNDTYQISEIEPSIWTDKCERERHTHTHIERESVCVESIWPDVWVSSYWHLQYTWLAHMLWKYVHTRHQNLRVCVCTCAHLERFGMRHKFIEIHQNLFEAINDGLFLNTKCLHIIGPLNAFYSNY